MSKGGRMMTTKEAAERLEVSEASVRVWLNDGEEKAKRFPNAVKFGRDWQIPEADVNKLPVGRKRGRPPKKGSKAQK
jgi:excisionase family DNA binding protein